MASLRLRRLRFASPTRKVGGIRLTPDADLFKKEFEAAQKSNESAGKGDAKEESKPAETKEKAKPETKEEAKPTSDAEAKASESKE